MSGESGESRTKLGPGSWLQLGTVAAIVYAAVQVNSVLKDTQASLSALSADMRNSMEVTRISLEARMATVEVALRDRFTGAQARLMRESILRANPDLKEFEIYTGDQR